MDERIFTTFHYPLDNTHPKNDVKKKVIEYIESTELQVIYRYAFGILIIWDDTIETRHIENTTVDHFEEMNCNGIFQSDGDSNFVKNPKSDFIDRERRNHQSFDGTIFG